MPILNKLFLKIENLGEHLKLFYKTHRTLTPKPNNILQKEKYKLISHEHELKNAKQSTDTLNPVIERDNNTSQPFGFISKIQGCVTIIM